MWCTRTNVPTMFVLYERFEKAWAIHVHNYYYQREKKSRFPNFANKIYGTHVWPAALCAQCITYSICIFNVIKILFVVPAAFSAFRKSDCSQFKFEYALASPTIRFR